MAGPSNQAEAAGELWKLDLTTDGELPQDFQASGASRAVRAFQPEHVVLDECSQMKEYEFVKVIARYGASLHRISLFGDPKQLPTNDLASVETEFARYSIMERLMLNGFQYVLLTRQYRMHPDISAFVSKYFYNDALITDESTFNRAADIVFENVALSYWSCDLQTIFIDVRGDNWLLRERNGTLSINPSTLSAMSGRNEGLVIVVWNGLQLHGNLGEKMRLTPNAKWKATLDAIHGRDRADRKNRKRVPYWTLGDECPRGDQLPPNWDVLGQLPPMIPSKPS